MTRLLTILTVLTTVTFSFSQNKRTFHWYFGEQAGIDFSSGFGILDTNNVIYSAEACASISDTSGNLLFYTNGDSVWNKIHNPMPNGFGLMGCLSATQGALIIPKPNDNNIYYIFTISWGCVDTIGDLRYSIVDMTLNGGLGDVTAKNVFLFSPVTEQLNAVRHCNGTDIWITTHELFTNKFYSYLMTSAGIDPIPVVSAIGSIYPSFFPNCVVAGELKFSPNGKKLAVAGSTCLLPFHITELFDFDNQTGVISNYISLPADSFDYGVSFSPDNLKLYYAGGWPTSHIVQYDLTVPTSSAIINSKIQIFSSPNVTLTGLQLSPDNKIYVARFWEDTLGIIQNPNSLGLSCNYVNNGLDLNGRRCHETFPNFVESFFSTTTDPCETTGLLLNETLNYKPKIYPNPTSQNATLEFYNSTKDNYTLTLYDIHGQLVLIKTDIITDRVQIERTNLTRGLYFFQLHTERQVRAIGKLVIE